MVSILKKSDLEKPGRENWAPDEGAVECSLCSVKFGLWTRRHHCRVCGNVVCGRCSSGRLAYTPRTRASEGGYTEKRKRVCGDCYTRISAEREKQAKINQALGHGGLGAPPDQMPGEGAYLAYQPDVGNGTMFIIWSKWKIEGALAYGQPHVKVPAHKFVKGGRTEVCSNVSSDKRGYFAAWCSFLQACSQFRCTIVDYGRTDGKAFVPVTLYLHHKSTDKVEKVSPNTPFTIDGVDIACAVHRDTKDLECQSMERALFCDRSEAAGAFIDFARAKFQTL